MSPYCPLFRFALCAALPLCGQVCREPDAGDLDLVTSLFHREKRFSSEQLRSWNEERLVSMRMARAPIKGDGRLAMKGRNTADLVLADLSQRRRDLYPKLFTA